MLLENVQDPCRCKLSIASCLYFHFLVSYSSYNMSRDHTVGISQVFGTCRDDCELSSNISNAECQVFTADVDTLLTLFSNGFK